MARSFNGTSDFIASNNSTFPVINTLSPFTMSCWAFPKASSGSPELIGATGGGYVLGIQVGSGANTGFNIAISGTTAETTNTTTPTINLWYSVVAVFNGNAGPPAGLQMYVNGSAIGGSSGTQPSATDKGLSIGRNLGGNGFWNGNIADVAVWNAALSVTEIIALAVGVRPGSIRASSLLEWHPLDGQGTPAIDLGPFKNNGILTGTGFVPDPPLLRPRPLVKPLAGVPLPFLAAAGPPLPVPVIPPGVRTLWI